jgi:hypothetical protein
MRYIVWISLIERSTNTIGKAELLLFREQVIVFISVLEIELEELVIVEFKL